MKQGILIFLVLILSFSVSIADVQDVGYVWAQSKVIGWWFHQSNPAVRFNIYRRSVEKYSLVATISRQSAEHNGVFYEGTPSVGVESSYMFYWYDENQQFATKYHYKITCISSAGESNGIVASCWSLFPAPLEIPVLNGDIWDWNDYNFSISGIEIRAASYDLYDAATGGQRIGEDLERSMWHVLMNVDSVYYTVLLSINNGEYLTETLPSSVGYASVTTSVTEIELTRNFSLHQNYPNPFNPITMIVYDLREANHVILAVYNTAGQLVANLVNKYQPIGNHQIQFDASHLPSGTYFSVLQSNDKVLKNKMLLLK